MSVTDTTQVPRSCRSPRPDNFTPETDDPCLLCGSTESERERVGGWVWCLDALPCRQRQPHRRR